MPQLGSWRYAALVARTSWSFVAVSAALALFILLWLDALAASIHDVTVPGFENPDILAALFFAADLCWCGLANLGDGVGVTYLGVVASLLSACLAADPHTAWFDASSGSSGAAWVSAAAARYAFTRIAHACLVAYFVETLLLFRQAAACERLFESSCGEHHRSNSSDAAAGGVGLPPHFLGVALQAHQASASGVLSRRKGGGPEPHGSGSGLRRCGAGCAGVHGCTAAPPCTSGTPSSEAPDPGQLAVIDRALSFTGDLSPGVGASEAQPGSISTRCSPSAPSLPRVGSLLRVAVTRLVRLAILLLLIVPDVVACIAAASPQFSLTGVLMLQSLVIIFALIGGVHWVWSTGVRGPVIAPLAQLTAMAASLANRGSTGDQGPRGFSAEGRDGAGAPKWGQQRQQAGPQGASTRSRVRCCERLCRTPGRSGDCDSVSLENDTPQGPYPSGGRGPREWGAASAAVSARQQADLTGLDYAAAACGVWAHLSRVAVSRWAPLRCPSSSCSRGRGGSAAQISIVSDEREPRVSGDPDPRDPRLQFRESRSPSFPRSSSGPFDLPASATLRGSSSPNGSSDYHSWHGGDDAGAHSSGGGGDASSAAAAPSTSSCLSRTVHRLLLRCRSRGATAAAAAGPQDGPSSGRRDRHRRSTPESGTPSPLPSSAHQRPSNPTPPPAAAAASLPLAEAEALRLLLRRLWRLVEIGFGEAGAAVVSKYIAQEEADREQGTGGVHRRRGSPLPRALYTSGEQQQQSQQQQQLLGGGGANLSSADAPSSSSASRESGAGTHLLPPPCSSAGGHGAVGRSGSRDQGARDGAVRDGSAGTAAAPQSMGQGAPTGAAGAEGNRSDRVFSSSSADAAASASSYRSRGEEEPYPGAAGSTGSLRYNFSSSAAAASAPYDHLTLTLPQLSGPSSSSSAFLRGGSGASALRGSGASALRGLKVHAVFMFCDIRHFTEITEALEEDVLAFVNDIARMVHGEVSDAGGAPNKNIGDAFLLTWKLPDQPLANVVVRARRRSAAALAMGSGAAYPGGTSGGLGGAARGGGGASFSGRPPSGALALGGRGGTGALGQQGADSPLAPNGPSYSPTAGVGMHRHRGESLPTMQRSGSSGAAISPWSPGGGGVGLLLPPPAAAHNSSSAAGSRSTSYGAAPAPHLPHPVPVQSTSESTAAMHPAYLAALQTAYQQQQQAVGGLLGSQQQRRRNPSRASSGLLRTGHSFSLSLPPPIDLPQQQQLSAVASPMLPGAVGQAAPWAVGHLPNFPSGGGGGAPGIGSGRTLGSRTPSFSALVRRPSTARPQQSLPPFSGSSFLPPIPSGPHPTARHPSSVSLGAPTSQGTVGQPLGLGGPLRPQRSSSSGGGVGAYSTHGYSSTSQGELLLDDEAVDAVGEGTETPNDATEAVAAAHASPSSSLPGGSGGNNYRNMGATWGGTEGLGAVSAGGSAESDDSDCNASLWSNGGGNNNGRGPRSAASLGGGDQGADAPSHASSAPLNHPSAATAAVRGRHSNASSFSSLPVGSDRSGGGTGTGALGEPGPGMISAVSGKLEGLEPGQETPGSETPRGTDTRGPIGAAGAEIGAAGAAARSPPPPLTRALPSLSPLPELDAPAPSPTAAAAVSSSPYTLQSMRGGTHGIGRGGTPGAVALRGGPLGGGAPLPLTPHPPASPAAPVSPAAEPTAPGAGTPAAVAAPRADDAAPAPVSFAPPTEPEPLGSVPPESGPLAETVGPRARHSLRPSSMQIALQAVKEAAAAAAAAAGTAASSTGAAGGGAADTGSGGRRPSTLPLHPQHLPRGPLPTPPHPLTLAPSLGGSATVNGWAPQGSGSFSLPSSRSSTGGYRRASSRIVRAAGALEVGVNPYCQRPGIQVIADNALAAAVNVLIRLHAANLPGGRLHGYATRTFLLAHDSEWVAAGARFRMGFGLHIGWAIEGAIGSSLKIDASYLSPAVNTTSRLESATKTYGVDLLLSQAFAECLSLPAQNLLRLVDRVQLKGVAKPFHLYTFDFSADAGLFGAAAGRAVGQQTRPLPSQQLQAEGEGRRRSYASPSSSSAAAAVEAADEKGERNIAGVSPVCPPRPSVEDSAPTSGTPPAPSPGMGAGPSPNEQRLPQPPNPAPMGAPELPLLSALPTLRLLAPKMGPGPPSAGRSASVAAAGSSIPVSAAETTEGASPMPHSTDSPQRLVPAPADPNGPSVPGGGEREDEGAVTSGPSAAASLTQGLGTFAPLTSSSSTAAAAPAPPAGSPLADPPTDSLIPLPTGLVVTTESFRRGTASASDLLSSSEQQRQRVVTEDNGPLAWGDPYATASGAAEGEGRDLGGRELTSDSSSTDNSIGIVRGSTFYSLPFPAAAPAINGPDTAAAAVLLPPAPMPPTSTSSSLPLWVHRPCSSSTVAAAAAVFSQGGGTASTFTATAAAASAGAVVPPPQPPASASSGHPPSPQVRNPSVQHPRGAGLLQHDSRGVLLLDSRRRSSSGGGRVRYGGIRYSSALAPGSPDGELAPGALQGAMGRSSNRYSSSSGGGGVQLPRDGAVAWGPGGVGHVEVAVAHSEPTPPTTTSTTSSTIFFSARPRGSHSQKPPHSRSGSSSGGFASMFLSLWGQSKASRVSAADEQGGAGTAGEKGAAAVAVVPPSTHTKVPSAAAAENADPSSHASASSSSDAYLREEQGAGDIVAADAASAMDRGIAEEKPVGVPAAPAPLPHPVHPTGSSSSSGAEPAPAPTSPPQGPYIPFPSSAPAPAPSLTVGDLALVQPESVFPLAFFEHAELAVAAYLGESANSPGEAGQPPDGAGSQHHTAADWPLARWHATQALALRPGDGPLTYILSVINEQGRGPGGTAPAGWPGFHALQSK